MKLVRPVGAELPGLLPVRWQRLPRPFYVMIAATLALGAWTGVAANPLFLFTTPVISLGLLAAAQERMRRMAGNRTSRFPYRVEREILDTLSNVSQSRIQRRFERFLSVAEGAYISPGNSGVAREDVTAMVVASCRAARDLNTIDESIRYLKDGPQFHTAIEMCARLEDCFERGTAVLKRISRQDNPAPRRTDVDPRNPGRRLLTADRAKWLTSRK